MGRSRRELLEDYLRVMNERDTSRMDEFLTPDYVEEYPQTGERIVGIENIRAIVENYPGGLAPGRMDLAHARVVGDEEQYVLGPNFSVIHVSGSGDTWIATALARYPDGSRWHVVMFIELRGERIARMTDYFAPELPAPEWRAQWVERFEHVD